MHFGLVIAVWFHVVKQIETIIVDSGIWWSNGSLVTRPLPVFQCYILKT